MKIELHKIIFNYSVYKLHLLTIFVTANHFMKNITTLFVVAGIIALASCKKDYNCRCSVSALGISMDTVISLGKEKKKDAKSQCGDYETTFQSQAAAATALTGIPVTVSCDIEKD
jgi:hypothetical protein